jgi:hypothetical protein
VRRRTPATRAVVAGLLAAVAIGACGSSDGPPASPPGPVVVTFEVVDERFKALLTEPADIDIARRLLDGEDVPNIPNGRVVRETGVNEGYSWSLDPSDFEFADVTVEVCDGLPSDVETNVISGDRYCPTSAVVIGIDPAG